MRTAITNKQWVLRLLGVALLLFGVLGHAERADARLDPFYIVHGHSYGKLKPRILFVVDSSATMRYEQPWPDVGCDWGECETWNDDQSRVHAARYVINMVTEAASDEADFALMTFGQAPLPKSADEVPAPCLSLDKTQKWRFVWVTSSNAPSYVKKIAGKWQVVQATSNIANPFGTQGTWLLCGDNKLFPYLRHDNLGSFALPDDSDAALPDVPLYKASGTQAGFANAVNRTRKVQWFPRYIGRRGNLDCGDQNQAAIVHGSYGDYGSTDADRTTQVCGRDFYYWPYVDGFPGYSWHTLNSPTAMYEEECDDNGVCTWQTDKAHRGGVSRRHESVGAGLFAPFYSKGVIDSPDIAAEDKGPLSDDDQWMMFDGMTRKAWEGGVDVSGNKPFIEVIGDLEQYLSFGGGVPQPTGDLLQSNAQLSHTSVSSYLAFISTVTESDVCRPMAMIFLTDAMPEDYKPSDNKTLYSYMRKFRTLLGVRTYVVGFSNEWWNNGLAWDGLNLMACSANGANNTSIPCGGQSQSNWDTCQDPEDHKNACAYRVATAEDLAAVLTDIIGQIIAAEVPSGAPTVANDFQLASPNDPESSQVAVQTSVSSWTDIPGYAGHVAREACTDADPDNPGQLAEYCQNAADLPVDTEETESFGPCPISRVWDAGKCLQQTDYRDRRLYTHDANNNVFRISDSTGKPTAEFTALITELNSQGLIKPPLSVNATTKKNEIQAMTEWLLGRNMPDGWKLPGLPNSAPILIRRVPKADENFLPTVGIRDPHCAGRRNGIGDNVPESLEEFSTTAWELSSGNGFGDHYDYTEAVLIGDDFGVLHGIHYDSGNELFGFVPRALINNARVLSLNGSTNYGQPEDISEHVYGIASTVNAGWAFDEQAGEWRHLAVFGLGPGGSEILTLDVSHMGRVQDDDPIEVVWTASTTSIADEYAATLGETWSRPALTYAVKNHAMSLEPKAYMVFGSGYREGVGAEERGRTVWVVDAITGETVTERAFMPVPEDTYDVEDDSAAISDIAVGSHCLSRYWGEMQEAYWADPAGRLYRWDIATNATDVDSFPHEADSGSKWQTNADDFAVAVEAFRFPACQSDDEYQCSIGPIGSGDNKGDVFTFSPAVAANNRIDDIDDPGDILPVNDRDQFLIALVSGSPNDTAIDGGDEDNDFHSSIYLLADDHRADKNGGFDIPGIGGLQAPGTHPHFMRLPLNQLERTRTIIFPDGTTQDETRNFSKKARPIRAPMIRVTGLADGQQQLDAEVFYITYTIYEPGSAVCNPKWYDEESGKWIADPGATYEVTFRLVISGTAPFDFNNGYTLPGDYGDGFGTGGKLSAPVVSQVLCEGENCGAKLNAPKTSPCDPNVDSPTLSGAISVQTGWSELDGFAPLETEL
ncbi:MAG TPA: hypothetical protein VM869_26775 [Enhygromyxa sp.]|nr:hypothetical protein [Enhygromyxa sp.]